MIVLPLLRRGSASSRIRAHLVRGKPCTRVISVHGKPAFLLVEVIMGIALFSIFLVATGLVFLSGQEGTEAGGDRIRAVYLAERSLEAARDIRGSGFDALTEGQHGLILGTGGTWEWSGTEMAASGSFLTSVTIVTTEPDIRQLQAETSWKHGYARSGSVLLTTELANWRTLCPTGNWATMPLTPEGSFSGLAGPLTSIALMGTTAFVTTASATGPGLYVLDLSVTTNPLRINPGFSLELGITGKAAAIKGKRLYILTSDTSRELQVFDITAPSTFSLTERLLSVDLPGDDLGLALRIYGTRLYVGLQLSGGGWELRSYDVSNSGALLPVRTGDVNGDVNAIAVTGTSAYLATDNPNQELAVSNTSGATLDPIGGRNIVNYPALAIAQGGTGILLGQAGAASSTPNTKLWFFKTGNGGLPLTDTPPFPYSSVASGTILGLAMDPLRNYGFVAADSGIKALQIMSIAAGLPERRAYNAAPPAKGRGVFYDAPRDRLYLLTTNAVLIFKPDPASPSRPCTE